MKKIKRISVKNFITMAAILLISFIIVGVTFAMFSYRFVMSEKRDTMSANAREIANMVYAYSTEWDLDGLEMRMVLSGFSRMSGYHIIMCDINGKVISCSDNEINCRHIGETISSSVIVPISSSGQYSGIGDLGGVYDQQRYVVGLALATPGKAEISGYIFISEDTKSMVQIWKQFSLLLILVSIGVMCVAFIISVITTKKQTKPINEMANAAHRFGRGDFSVRVSETGRADEIGELTDAFNTMASSLERSENMRRELIANVSHELKTPMTTIIGFADGIIDGTIPQEKQAEYLNVISSEAKRLSRLVRNMLNMSQVQEVSAAVIEKGSFDVAETIRLSLLSLEKKITDRGLNVDARLPEEPVVVKGDKDSILQVVYNLIDNAIKFAAADSTLIIDLWRQGAKAYVSVENNGETIAPEEIPFIFERFHKTDKSRSMDRDGVGLGLYISKTILDNHNEDIYVTSSEGVTKFVFTLTLR